MAQGTAPNQNTVKLGSQIDCKISAIFGWNVDRPKPALQNGRADFQGTCALTEFK